MLCGMALLLVSIWHVHTTLYTYLEVGGCLSCYIGLALLLACIWHVSVSGMSSPPTSRQEAAMYEVAFSLVYSFSMARKQPYGVAW